MSKRKDIELNGEDRDLVVDMINWVINDLDGSDPVTEEDAQAERDFKARIEQLAEKMGLERVQGYGNNWS